MTDKQLILIIQSFLMVGVCIALMIVLYRPVYIPKVTKCDKLLKELGSTKIISEDLKVVELFKKDTENYLVIANLEWGDDVEKFISLCEFATRILKVYNNNSNEDIYLLLVSDIINRINNRVFKQKKNEVLKKEDDYKAIVYMTRLFNAFEYIANDKYMTTKTICHDLILYLLPEFNHIRILGIWFNSENIIYTIIPRLLTHYLEPDKKNYLFDIEENHAFEILENKFSDMHNFPDKRANIYLYDYYYDIYQILKEKEEVDYFKQF